MLLTPYPLPPVLGSMMTTADRFVHRHSCLVKYCKHAAAFLSAWGADQVLRMGVQVQNILLLHDERLEGLEACAPAAPPGQGPPDQARGLAAGAALSGSTPPMLLEHNDMRCP